MLSNIFEADVNVDSLCNDYDFFSEITRAEFDKICKPLFNKCFVCVDKALEDAGLQKEEIDEVMLVGGSCRIPAL